MFVFTTSVAKWLSQANATSSKAMRSNRRLTVLTVLSERHLEEQAVK
jgi:hypothetical protein